jgi:eukaryotic-like serine/threonine-protein kinase
VGPLLDQANAVDSFPRAFHRYRLFDLLARGRAGSVYYARHNDAGANAGAWLALKQIAPDSSRDPQLAERWLRAGRRVSPLIHPGLCRVYEVGIAQGTPFCAMELIAGIDLGRLCARLLERGELMPVDCIAWVMSNVASALDAAHSRREQGAPGIVHGNLTASNILVGYDGVVKVTDVGLSTALSPSPPAPEPRGAGASPEVRADVGAMGARLLELLGVRRPGDAQSERAASGALRGIALRAVDGRSENRYPSAAAFRQAIDECTATRGVAVSAPTLSDWLGPRFEAERRAEEELLDRWLALPRSGAALHRGDSGKKPRMDLPAQPPSLPKPAPAAARASRQVRSDPDKTPPRGVLAERLAAEMGQAAFNSEPTRLGPLPAVAASPTSPKLAVSSRPGPLWPHSDRSRSTRQRIWLLGAAGGLVAALALLSRQTPEPPKAPGAGPQTAAPQVAAPNGIAPQVATAPPTHPIEPSAGKRELAQKATPLRHAEPSAPRPEAAGAAVQEALPEPDAAEPAMPDLVVSAGTGSTSRSVALSIASSPKRKPPRVQSARSEPTGDDDGSELAAPDDPQLPAPTAAVTASPEAANPPQVTSPPVTPPPAPVRAPQPAVAVREATPIAQSAPRFPARARRRGVRSGNVSIAFSVDRTGQVRNPVVIESNPTGIFDEAALESVNQWRYQPRLEAGVPVESHGLRVRLLFSDGS